MYFSVFYMTFTIQAFKPKQILGELDLQKIEKYSRIGYLMKDMMDILLYNSRKKEPPYLLIFFTQTYN